MFLKFGKKEDILDLFENGTVYINAIQYFRKLDNDELRGDSYEGVSEIKNSLPGSVDIPTINHTLNYISVHIPISYEEVLGNIYSLYCISSMGFPNPLEFKIDQRIKKFGSHCLLIKDNPKFLNFILDTLKADGYKVHNGFVEYYDRKKINRKVNLFEKPLEFEYQKEFRIYVENDGLQAMKINIGSLKDYSEVYETDAIIDGMRLELTK